MALFLPYYRRLCRHSRKMHIRSMGITPNARFDSVCIHGGWDGDASSGSAAVPVHRTSPYIFKDTDTAAARFSLRELGMIYSRLGNPTSDVLERRFALLNGAHENGALAVASAMRRTERRAIWF